MENDKNKCGFALSVLLFYTGISYIPYNWYRMILVALAQLTKSGKVRKQLVSLYSYTVIQVLLRIIFILKKGIFQSISGPTLTVLSSHVCESPTKVGWIFTARSVGFLIGSLLPTVAEKYHADQMLFLSLSVLICGISISVVPIITDLWIWF